MLSDQVSYPCDRLGKRIVNFCADPGNEDLRAQINTLQYELESLKQEREVTNLRHQKELREVQNKAEADFRRAQVGWVWAEIS